MGSPTELRVLAALIVHGALMKAAHLVESEEEMTAAVRRGVDLIADAGAYVEGGVIYLPPDRSQDRCGSLFFARAN